MLTALKMLRKNQFSIPNSKTVAIGKQVEQFIQVYGNSVAYSIRLYTDKYGLVQIDELFGQISKNFPQTNVGNPIA